MGRSLAHGRGLGEGQVLEPHEGLHAFRRAVGEAVALLLRDHGALEVGEAGLDALGGHAHLVLLLHLLLEEVSPRLLDGHLGHLRGQDLRVVLPRERVSDESRHF